MRDRTHWRRNLTRHLKNVWPAQVPDGTGPGMLCDVELGLYLAEQVLPEQPVAAAWALWAEYGYAEGLGIPVSGEQRRMQQVAAHLLDKLVGRRNWERNLAAYRALPEGLRGWTVDEDFQFHRRDPSAAPDRFAVYDQTLRQAPPLRRGRVALAAPGRYRVASTRDASSVTIPERLVTGSASAAHPLIARSDRGPVTFTWEELRDTAEQLDAIETSWPEESRGNWMHRFADLRLKVRDGSGFRSSDRLTIAGMLHLIGMVGAGKSTLMQLAAAAAAFDGKQITLVVADVLSCLRLTVWFDRIGIRAAPVVGASGRERHIRRLEQVHAEDRAGASPLAGHGAEHDLLSTACGLDGLREQPDRPWGYREAPCHEGLADPDSPDERYSCPIALDCPRHRSSRDLVDAQVWLATPAGLIASRIPVQINAEQVRYLEVAWRRSDLFIIDEADAVQTQLDTLFSPSQTLFGATSDSWLEELAEHVERQLRAGRYGQFIANPAAREWVDALNIAKNTVSKLYQLLPREPLPRGSSVLRHLLTGEFFTEWTLAEQLLHAWMGTKTAEEAGEHFTRFRVVLDAFLTDPLGEQGRSEDPLVASLVDLANQLLGATTETARAEPVRAWIAQAAPERELNVEDRLGARMRRLREAQVLLLEFIVLLAVLSQKLNQVTRDWRTVDAVLNLDGTRGSLFQNPPDDYTPIVPAPVMGSVLGYLYREDTDRNDQLGQLGFFHCRGVGRALLLGLHDLFRADSQSGPAVMLMSGTSWAGTSPRYDLQIPPGAILEAPEKETKGVEATEFFGPETTDTADISVSGLSGERRIKAFRDMLHKLVHIPRPGRPSQLERELAGRDEGRQRALLVVGSYEEAKQVAETLLELRGDWAGRVAYLVRDDDPASGGYASALRRGHLSRFAAGGADILIAPLLAVERGHNILNEDHRAAIGSVYFLVRPHPRPDDITYPIQEMNRWTVEQIAALSAGDHRFDTTDLTALANGVRNHGYRKWRGITRRPMVYGSMDNTFGDQDALAWTQLVTIWQVIGRLVRGGVAARVFFCDAKFNPDLAGSTASLLRGMYRVLDQIFSDKHLEPSKRDLAEALYGPLWRALDDYFGRN